jgi:hypothetical protein
MDDLLHELLTEAGESLDTVDNQLVHFEQDPNNARILDNIFRFTPSRAPAASSACRVLKPWRVLAYQPLTIRRGVCQHVTPFPRKVNGTIGELVVAAQRA